MKALLLQLPIQGHDFFFSRENIPLAAAYLKAIGNLYGADVEIVPRSVMSFGSDQAILRFLLDAKADLVGMSCYLWNVERSLFLAGELKRERPECTVVLGGPEITPDNQVLLKNPNFDIAVTGEGETPWRAILESYPRIPHIPGALERRVKGSGYFIRALRPNSLAHWPSAYLSGALDDQVDGVLWLETVRGCVHRCAYCYYHKQFPRLRSFPLDRIVTEIERARRRRLREIVFLDPCFTRHPRLQDLLDALVSVNRDQRLRFSAELNVEDIDPEIARKMAQAGFQEVEVGLQSTNLKTLHRIHRRFHPVRFLEGVRRLQAEGIKVMVDIIAGLPGDRFSDICRSLDWVIEKEAYDFLMLYPLALLPATELRQKAHELQLFAMDRPPYLVTGAPGLSAEDIHAAFRYYEERMGEDISPLEMPPALAKISNALDPLRKLCHLIEWLHPEGVNDRGFQNRHMAYALTLRMGKEVLRTPRLWTPVLKNYLQSNPYSLLSVEVPADSFPEDLHPLWKLVREHCHPLDRDYTVTHTPYRSIFIFSRMKGLTWKWPDPRESTPVVLPNGQTVSSHPVLLLAGTDKDVPSWFLEHIAKRYPSPPEIRLWQPPEDEL